MCGISGIYNSTSSEDLSEKIKQMTNVLSHRGPDGEGFYFSENGKLTLGHRRLAIIDLSDDAKQPMEYLSRYVITYNGEIYNYIELKETLKKKGYKFFSSSDTEVLLALYDWGKEKCLDYLDGMFAFAIYDKQEEFLFCARDRFGEKPFYYFHDEGKQFLFASEMKSLFSAGIERRVNNRMLYNYLAWNYVSNPLDTSETFYQEIKQLAPAHYVTTDKNLKIKIHKYWEIDYKKQDKEISFEAAKDECKKLLYESTLHRLRSDVPVGSCLSGGLDSSILVSIINDLNKENSFKQKTFSARFKNFDKDEGKYIDTVNKYTHAEGHEVYPTVDSFLKNVDEIFYYQEEPFLSTSIAAQYEVMKLAKQNGVKVLLDGQGADEIFGGYDYLVRAYFQELLSKNPKKYKKEWKKYADIFSMKVEKDIKFHSQALFPKTYRKLENIKRVLRPKNYSEMNREFYIGYSGISFQNKIRSKPDFNYMLYESTTGDAMRQILRHADRNSMAHSVEVRLPFLSHKLVEFIFSLPASYKIAEGWPKYLLRKSFEDILPSEIVWRKDKIGFETPQEAWLKNSKVQDLMHESKSTLVKENLLSKTVLEKNRKPVGDLDWRYWMASKLVSEK